jgi:hypothetical protein
MCDCVDVEMGSYKNQVPMVPFWKDEPIGIDKCLSSEISDLWDDGIVTTGCCCGHNKAIPMINVLPEYHHAMVARRYEFWENLHGTTCYKPKSIKSKIMKVYISGKITGLPIEKARANFEKTAELIRARGWEPVNPFEVLPYHPDLKWEDYMKADIAALTSCDGIWLNDDWILSKGARLEAFLANELNIPIVG